MKRAINNYDDKIRQRLRKLQPRWAAEKDRSPRTIMEDICWEKFYRSELGPLFGYGVWRTALCCFHDDHRPSLRVNIETGGYWCPVCEARGDGIRFLRERYGYSFGEALRTLEDLK